MPQEKHSGTLLVESDTGNVFVDDSDEVRVQLTDTSKISRHGDKFDNGFKDGEIFRYDAYGACVSYSPKWLCFSQWANDFRT